jgi:hypothetical protein
MFVMCGMVHGTTRAATRRCQANNHDNDNDDDDDDDDNNNNNDDDDDRYRSPLDSVKNNALHRMWRRLALDENTAKCCRVELGGRGEAWELLRYTNRSGWHVDFYSCVTLDQQAVEGGDSGAGVGSVSSTRNLMGAPFRKASKRGKGGSRNSSGGGGGGLDRRWAVESFQWDPPPGWEKEYVRGDSR